MPLIFCRASRKSGGPGIPYASPLGPNARFVSASATGSGNGTFYRPWTVAQGISSASPDHRVYMRGGFYDFITNSGYDLTCAGMLGHLIVWSSYPGEQAFIRYVGPAPWGSAAGMCIKMSGQYLALRDVRIAIMSNGVSRNFGTDINTSGRQACVQMANADQWLINCFIHDSGGSGPQSFEAGLRSVTYGNLISNYGYTDNGGGKGQGVYQGNLTAGAGNHKVVKHNIISYGFGASIKTAGDAAGVVGFRVTQNIMSMCGVHQEVSLGVGTTTSGWEIYSNTDGGVTGSRYNGNLCYWPASATSGGGGGISKSFTGGIVYDDIEMNDNEWLGRVMISDPYGYRNGMAFKRNVVGNDDYGNYNAYHFFFNIRAWDAPFSYKAGMIRRYGSGYYKCNTDHVAGSGASFDASKWDVWTPSNYDFTDNAYYGAWQINNPSAGQVSGGFSQIVTQTPDIHAPLSSWATFIGGGEARSTAAGGTGHLPPDTSRVYRNDYEHGRAQVGIWNGNALASSVTVAMTDWETGAAILSAGDPYYVWNASNPDYGIVAQGTYNGVGISFPMTPAAVGNPMLLEGGQVAVPGYVPPTTYPSFGQFIVRKCPYAPGYAPDAALAVDVTAVAHD